MMSHNKKQPNSTQKKKMKTFEMCNNYFQETLCVTQTRKQKEKPHSTKDDGTISPYQWFGRRRGRCNITIINNT